MCRLFKRSLILFIFFFTAHVQAQVSPYLLYFCKKEYSELCKDKPNQPFQCLKNFPAKRSPLCNAAYTAYDKELRHWFGPCFDEKANNCKNLEPGTGLISACLEKVIGSLSKACVDYIKAPANSRYDDLKLDSLVPCADIIQKYCSNVKTGNGQRAGCLKKNINNITSKECKVVAADLL